MPIHGLPLSLPPAHPPHFDIERLIRPNILALHPYRCARDDYNEGILLDANENALGHSISRPSYVNGDAQHATSAPADVDDDLLALDLHRYPSPSHPELKSRIAELRGLPGPEHVFLGVGSDEVLDLLMRVCVVPGGAEGILVTPPTYGMYGVCAQVNDVRVVKVDLELSGEKGEGGEEGRFSVRVDAVKEAVAADPGIKLIFLCSPGNPTGTLISLSALRSLLSFEPFKGLVIVDEAYIDFSPPGSSAVSLVNEFANLCVVQTLSKSFGLAAIRCALTLPTATLAARALAPASLSLMQTKLSTLAEQRTALLAALAKISALGPPIGASHANFVLMPVLGRESREPDSARAQRVYKALAEEEGVVVRFRGTERGCAGCLRITVGSAEENGVVLARLTEVLERS